MRQRCGIWTAFALLSLVACSGSDRVFVGATTLGAGARQKTNTEALGAGDGQCPSGGVLVESFLDVDNDGAYTPSVDRDQTFKKICNGLDGKPSDAVVLISALPNGHEACPNGGTRFEGFRDRNGNGIYDEGDENRSLTTACSGSQSVTVVAAVGSVGGECPGLGGTRFESFTDVNGNGAFDGSVDLNRSSRTVCNTPPRRIALSDLAPNDPACSGGGRLVRAYTDLNGNGSFESGTDVDVEERKVCHGTNGRRSVVLQTVVPAGPTCASGGVSIETFLDANEDGTYNAGDSLRDVRVLCSGQNGQNGKTPLVLQTQINPNTDPTCRAGGYHVTSFVDANGNGTYESADDLNFSEAKICHGASARILKTNLGNDPLVCPSGGAQFDVFTDVNANGSYEAGVDTDFSSQKICNGLNGGTNGSDAGLVTSVLAPGQGGCPSGGFQYDSFIDRNGNGVYDAGTDAYRALRTVCHGARAAVVTTNLAPGDATCPAGGVKYEAFTDANNDGAYGGGDTGYSAYSVCRGPAGHSTRMAMTSFGTGTGSCGGRAGVTVQSWLDLNDNGAYDAGSEAASLVTQVVCDGASGANGATGANGVSRGLTVALVAPGTVGAVTGQAGVNCTEGGLRYTTWAEIGAPDNMMQEGENASASSLYVCNARRRLMRSTAFAAGAGTTADNAACPNGGYRMEFGYDDFDTAGGTIGALDAGEVNGALTQRVCHGADAGRNLFINGAMRISQRTAGGAVTGHERFAVDRTLQAYMGAGVIEAQRVTSSVPDGFTHALRLTVATASGAVGAGEYYVALQRIEGYNTARLGFGTSSAQPMTLSFWVRSSQAGQYSVAFRNATGDRSLVASYTIAQTDTWEKKVVTVPGDTSGTWYSDERLGLEVIWSLGMGSDFTTATLGAWQNGNHLSTPGAVNWMETLTNTFFLSGVQLEKGTAATAFEHRTIQEDLSLCQRYFSKSYPLGIGLGAASSEGLTYGTTTNLSGIGNATSTVYLPTSMRTPPTLGFFDLYGNVGWMRDSISNIASILVAVKGENSFVAYNGSNALGISVMYHFHWWADAEF